METYIFDPFLPFYHKKYTDLDYNRSLLGEGVAIISKSTFLAEKLNKADHILVHLSFQKIGDGLLALGGIKALTDYLQIKNIRKKIYYEGAHYDLIWQMFPSFIPHEEVLPGERFIISNDKEIKCDLLLFPEDVPVWHDPFTEIFYSPLPKRYYLWVEQALGTVLRKDVDAAISETVFLYSGLKKQENFSIVIINCSSMVGRKNYLLSNFLKLTEKIKNQLGDKKAMVYVVGEKMPGELVFEKNTNEYGSTYIEVNGGSLYDTSRFLSTVQLVIGNDTGITHLAAMSQSHDHRPQVMGLYNRHGFSKWNTGLKGHIGVANCFSLLMSQYDVCPVRDVIDERIFSPCSDINMLSIEEMYGVCVSSIELKV